MRRSALVDRTPEQKVGIESGGQERLRQIVNDALKEAEIDRAAKARRLRALRKNSVFARETELVMRALNRAITINPDCVSSFFRRFPSPSALRGVPARRFLDGLPEGGVRKALQSYSRYAL